MIEATMKRAAEYGASQYQAVVDYIESLGIDKPIHIGESGWASSDGAAYGEKGSKAADEYKEKMFYQYMREWTDAAGVSLFYFEAFDERWKDSADASGSENHFGLIRLNNEVKYALWDLIDNGSFEGLTRNTKPLFKSYGGDEEALLNEVLNPPFKSTMPKRKINTVNKNTGAGEAITASTYVVVHDSLMPSKANNMIYPSAILKLIPWEGTVSIEMSYEGIISIKRGRAIGGAQVLNFRLTLVKTCLTLILDTYTLISVVTQISVLILVFKPGAIWMAIRLIALCHLGRGAISQYLRSGQAIRFQLLN